jgi:hypothetical protein
MIPAFTVGYLICNAMAAEQCFKPCLVSSLQKSFKYSKKLALANLLASRILRLSMAFLDILESMGLGKTRFPSTLYL